MILFEEAEGNNRHLYSGNTCSFMAFFDEVNGSLFFLPKVGKRNDAVFYPIPEKSGRFGIFKNLEKAFSRPFYVFPYTFSVQGKNRGTVNSGFWNRILFCWESFLFNKVEKQDGFGFA